MASGTGLYNLKKAAWDEELCESCYVRPAKLGLLGDRCLTSNRGPKKLSEAVLFSAIGDGAAGNLGSGADQPAKIAINIGTSAAVRMTVPQRGPARIPFGLFKYVLDDERVIIGGAISNGGNLRQWCLRELQLPDNEDVLSRKAAATDALTILPFWVGERAPTWPESLRGTIVGLIPSTSAGDILRAATTSTFYRLAEILDLLPANCPRDIIVSGGVLYSPASLKILADCLGQNIRASREPESSLRGAAVHALESLGYKVPPLRTGKLIRYRPALTKSHRIRRDRQRALENLLARNP